MRILSLRFKNLNSLQGEWKIDFTDPAYESDGIFAITGPTGAGKTTILDAVCLALYGRTPRLKDVTQSTNEIISRHTGECFAEIVFETGPHNGAAASDIGRYCVFWGQHRARKKPDGTLQPPRREIADIATGEILETRQRDVDEKVEALTGLSFDQFVRSVLLAQGSFSIFLQSGAGERSPILEQITGTEIYSQISVRTHEIRNTERAALAALESEMSGLNGLGSEEKEELEKKLEAKLGEEAVLEKEAERCKAELEWLEGMTGLQNEVDILEEQSRELTRRQEGFDSERRRLERAQKALEFGSAHAALVMLRREQETEKRTLLEYQMKLPVLETEVRRSEEAMQLAVSMHTEKQTEQKNILDLLRKVRELDLKAKEKEKPILEAQSAAEELSQNMGILRTELEADQLRLESAQVRLRDVRKFLQSNAVDERLLEQLAGIRTRFDALRSSLERRERLAAENASAEERKLAAQNLLNGQSILYETVKAKFVSIENGIKKQQGALAEILGTRSLQEWRAGLADLMERKARQARVQEILERRAETADAGRRAKERFSELDLSRKKLAQKTDEQRKKIGEAEKEVRHLEVQMELVRRIKDLEEARQRLQDGEPCPLCGSLSHPYASGNIPQADEIELGLRNAKEELRKSEEELSAFRVQSAQLDQEIFQTEEEGERLRSQLETIEAQLVEQLAELQLILPMDMDPLTGIGRQQQKTEEILQKTRIAVERAENIEKDLAAARDNLEKIREERDQLARSQQEAEFGKESATREWNRLSQEIRLHEEELKNIRLDLGHQISPFGFKNLPDEKPGQVLEQLEARLSLWQEQHQLRLDLEKQISVWERDLHHARSNLDNLGLELKDRNEAAKKLRSEKEALRQQRASLFGEKDPDDEEAAQAKTVDAAQKQVEEKREARETAQQELSKMRSRMEDLGRAIHIRADSLQKAEISFGKQLLANDFKNEEAYLAACLSEEERKALQDRSQALLTERAELDARRTDRKFALEELRRKSLTDRLPEEVRENRGRTVSLLKELQQSIGAMRMRLRDEEDFSRLRRERTEAIEKQKKEYLRWEKLHDLIGSADGQKYRNFVQALTLEMVVRHANRQLQRMTDRYLLVRDDEQALELKVVDGYQAGEIRSTKNLSGGESFIVSLALALGLSQMASRKVRMDSLFLDEGFGTLDEEALDTALSTLAGLRREGKLIGVISHVEALKERIGTQIEIVPQGNGRSIIRAPGCTQGPE